MESVFIGRQPILDRNGKLYAYELLHRRKGESTANGNDGDRMSSDMLLNASLEVGIQKITATHTAFINITRNLLLNGCLDSLPTQRIGLEILETVTVDQQLLDRLRTLKKRGFKIALDDFVCLPERSALIDYADIVKLDVLALDDSTLEQHVRFLRQRGVRLLAEKVETGAMHTRARGLGFDLFQGYFFARPETYTGQRIRPNNLVLLQLLARVNDPNITPNELSAIIRGDVSMSVTVLRWANSPYYGMRYVVESVERAVVVLGLLTIRNWVSLLALARMGSNATELHTTILVRARTCELVALAARAPNASSYFTVGLLSALDIILQVDMAQALEYMPLGDEQKAALLARTGKLGEALDCMMALEAGNTSDAAFSNLPLATITACYFEAVAWADHLATSR